MKVAYLILVHKSAQQVRRLISRLNNGKNVIVLHVDSKSESLFQDLSKEFSDSSFVFFSRRRNVNWARFSIVCATLEMFKTLKEKQVDYDFATILSGQDYPIKTNFQIESFLSENKGKIFLENFLLPSKNLPMDGLDRLQGWDFPLSPRRHFIFPHFLKKLRGLRFFYPYFSFFKRVFPRSFKPFAGSAWFTVPSECVNFMMDFVKKEKNFLAFFKRVMFPDEMFFQTVIMNSPFANQVENCNLRYIKWQSAPLLIKKDSIGDLEKSSAHFARKLDQDVDSEILDLIDKRILKLPEIGPLESE
ncbi:MAG: hypothetical protein HQM08_08925 [Candidatus Riflebacteria bacterium]|nr:hypothetical protein [Candidatus Riflebacteria bacterium]